MSYILQALERSERERKQRETPQPKVTQPFLVPVKKEERRAPFGALALGIATAALVVAIWAAIGGRGWLGSAGDAAQTGAPVSEPAQPAAPAGSTGSKGAGDATDAGDPAAAQHRAVQARPTGSPPAAAPAAPTTRPPNAAPVPEMPNPETVVAATRTAAATEVAPPVTPARPAASLTGTPVTPEPALVAPAPARKRAPTRAPARASTPPVEARAAPQTVPRRAAPSSAARASKPEARVAPDRAIAAEGSSAGARRDIGASRNPDPAAPDSHEFAGLPTIAGLSSAFRASLPELALNAHVYSDAPASRRVVLNLRGYGEGDRLVNGMEVVAITRSGVVLRFQGTRFLLPR